MTRLFLALAVIVAALGAPRASAHGGDDSLHIGLRVLRFALGVSAGSTVAVLYDPASAASAAEARMIVAAHPGGLRDRDEVLRVESVRIDALDRLGRARVAYVTRELNRAQHAAIARAVENRGVVTITADVACVRAGLCVLGVETEPRVEFFVSEAASRRAGLSWTNMFLITAREL